ncbi:hypothetical protein ES703_74678 [subsurface metagenome]
MYPKVTNLQLFPPEKTGSYRRFASIMLEKSYSRIKKYCGQDVIVNMRKVITKLLLPC